MKTLISFLLAGMISLAAWTAQAEPVQFETYESHTRVYLDLHNRSWLDVDYVETLLVFYDSTGEECHRELIYITFERPIRHQGHAEFYLDLPKIPNQATRAEASFSY